MPSQEGAGPLILSWINEICSDDTEKRALLVAAANDLAYVVQAVVCYRFHSFKTLYLKLIE
jgi:ACS family pantothenate transporter-like MFS transporter